MADIGIWYAIGFLDNDNLSCSGRTIMKKTKAVNPSQAQRIVRCISDIYFLIEGLRCNCGGQIAIKDWRTEVRREIRYEAYCEKCQKCDPNGYLSIRKTGQGAEEYFVPKKQNTSSF